MDAQVRETLTTAMIASLEETLLMGVNVSLKSTMTEVLVLTATVIAQSAQDLITMSARLVQVPWY